MRPRPILAAIAVAALVLAGCGKQDLIRVLDTVAEYNCIVSDRLPGAEPCPEPVKAEPGAPVFCYHTIAGTECYAEENPFGLKPGWLRSPPPDIGG